MAIVFESAQQSSVSAETSVVTANIDITADTDYLVIYGGGKKAPTGASFNSVAASTSLEVSSSVTGFVSMFYMLKANLPSPTTTLAVTVTFDTSSASADRFAGVLAFKGVAQQAPEATYTYSATSASTAGVTHPITTETDGALVVDVAMSGSTTLTTGSTDVASGAEGETIRLTGDTTGLRVMSSTKAILTAGSTSMTWIQTSTILAGYVPFAYASMALTPYTNAPPTIDLGTPGSPADEATGVSLTPTFDFTGTDPDSDDVEYEIQICSDINFNDN